jgi:hypothetical protein
MNSLLLLMIGCIIFLSCKKNAANSTPAEIIPTIASINPGQGAPGTVFTITGTNLNLINSVSLNGTSVFYETEDSLQVEVQVPSTARSGPVSVVYDGGSAAVTSSMSFTVLPPVDASGPIVTDLLPNANPVAGPVLIYGKNIDSATSISFGNVPAVIDTNFAGVVTTRVPGSLEPGLVELTITKQNGTTCSVPFTVLGAYPQFTAPIPPKILFFRPPLYIPRIQNDWFNEYGSEDIFIPIPGNPQNETINGEQFPFTITALDTTVNMTIQLTIQRGNDPFGNPINEIYQGQFVEGTDTTFERILFYNGDGRQVVVSVSL